MSVHYEWFNLPRVEFVGHGWDVADQEYITDPEEFAVTTVEGGALLLSNDDVAVVTGTPKELLDWALNLVEVIAANQRTVA